MLLGGLGQRLLARGWWWGVAGPGGTLSSRAVLSVLAFETSCAGRSRGGRTRGRRGYQAGTRWPPEMRADRPHALHAAAQDMEPTAGSELITPSR